ncbi:MAG: glycerophosphodiester phosphodiesterase [Microthrixaceae bacterium]|nr:glycerophosphodiester phosphodiesterase [Microthrixaceae bacterium]
MPKVIGHRGASADWPENTVAAFVGASSAGADWVELDVRLTALDEPVVIHDPFLPDGRVVCELRGQDLPPSIPGLREALHACSPMGVNVEIKHAAEEPGFSADRHIAEIVVSALADAPSEVLISSFDLAVIDRCRSLAPHVPTAYLVLDARSPSGAIEACVEGGHSAIHPWDPGVDEALVAAAHHAGLALNVWTVDDPERIACLARWGVDGIVTNVPALARQVLGR